MSDNVIEFPATNELRGKVIRVEVETPFDKTGPEANHYESEYDTINTSIQEVAAKESPHNGGDFMTDSFFDEIKKDMREREERTRQEISEREQRFEATIERYTQEAKERELRYREDSKEREERITQIAQNIETRTNETVRHTEIMKTQNFWGNIALFVGMLAIVITLIIVI